MQIREDLKDISNNVAHLMSLGEYLCNKYREWTIWWGQNSIYAHLVKTNDGKVLNIGVNLYYEGRDSVYDLGMLLQEINSIKHCPRLKDYINKVKAFRKDCIPTGEKLLSQCEQIISTRKSCGMVSDIKLMMDWHKETLNILRNLDSELTAIEGSERYKIEEQMLMQEKPAERVQNATPTRRRETWPCVKRIPRWIYVLVIFFAALLTCIYLSWWLWITFWKK